MVKPTTVNDLGLLAAQDRPSEDAISHWRLVLGVRHPSQSSPIPTVILKYQIRLFCDLKNATYYLAFLLWVLELYNLMFGQKRAIVRLMDD